MRIINCLNIRISMTLLCLRLLTRKLVSGSVQTGPAKSLEILDE